MMTELRVIKNRKAKIRRKRIRRFTTLGILAGIFSFAIYITYVNSNARLEHLRAELEYYQTIQNEVMLSQRYYLNQIVRLEDEEYIAMLARQRYRVSLPDETVFRIINVSSDDSSQDLIDDTLEKYYEYD